MPSVDSPRPTDWRWPLLLALLAFAAIWSFGAGFPSGNNVYHVPLVLDYAGSAEGPHDAFHRSLDAFVSLFWSGVAWTATEANIRPLFLVLLLATTIGTVLAAYATLRAAGAQPAFAAGALGLLSFGFVSRGVLEFGGGELLSPSLTHSQAATALCLGALAFAVRGRWLPASIVCGLAADVNLFLGFWTMAALAFARLLDGLERDRRIDWTHLLGMAAACLVAASPAIFWALGAVGTAAAPVPYREFLEDYHPYHFFAHHEAWLFGAHLGLLLVASLALRQQATSEPLRRLAGLLGGSAITLLAGAITGYLTDQPLVLNLHPLRFAAVAYWLAAIGVIALAAHQLATGAPRRGWSVIAVAGFLAPSPTLTVFALALVLDLGLLRTWQRIALVIALGASWMVDSSSDGRFDFPLWLRIGPAPALALVALLSALALRLDPRGSRAERLAGLAFVGLLLATRLVEQPLVAALAGASAIGLGWQLRAPAGDRRYLAITMIVAAVLAFVLVMQPELRMRALMLLVLLFGAHAALELAPARWLPSVGLAMVIGAAALAAVGLAQSRQRGLDFPRWEKDEAWFDVQAWARANTAPDTVFYAPDRFGFATLSRRPVWWDHNQGAAVMWSPAYYAEWSSRREMALRATGAGELAELAQTHGIRFVVRECEAFDASAATHFAVKYRNDVYCIAEPAPPPAS